MPLIKAKNHFILFYHIPKTGGTTIEDLYGQSDLPLFSRNGRSYFVVSGQHFDHSQLSEIGVTELTDSSFCIVRDPVDRVISEYFHRKKENKLFRSFVSFRSYIFLIAYCAKYLPRMWDNHILPQSSFIGDNTQIYKFESGFENISNSIERDFGLKKVTQLSIKNKGNREEVSLDKDTLSIIYSIYAKDYECFGYEKTISNMKCSKFNLLKSRVFGSLFFSGFYLFRILSGKGITSLKL